MPERVIVRQNRQYEVDILVSDPANPESESMQLVDSVYDFSPFTMMLASLGTCTTILIHSYAKNHRYPVEEAEVRLAYVEGGGDDEIVVFVDVRGEGLSETDRQRLIQISSHCSIHKILDKGIPIQWNAFDAAAHDAAHGAAHDHDHEQHEHDA